MAWHRKEASKLLQRTLVLLADHELNASTFAARVAVSTGASLAAGVLAGLCTLTGPLHGGAAAGVWELVEAAQSQGAEQAVRERLAQGRPMAGFGHPLYPAGDPRAASLLRHLDLPAEYTAVREAVEQWVGERPNIDFALAAMTRTQRLPQEAPLILFALARSVGWLAHELEQVATGHLIRPRARYVGTLPGT
jgi:citrate synthase